MLRACLWSAALGLSNQNGLAVFSPISAKPPQIQFALKSSVVYATG